MAEITSRLSRDDLSMIARICKYMIITPPPVLRTEDEGAETRRDETRGDEKKLLLL